MCSSTDLWTEAYGRIYKNRGALTKGVDEVTLDGMSHERINDLIELVKNGKYEPKPSRRTHIPKDARKPNGKKRPLGIPNGDDKLVQQVMKVILKAIYEQNFSDWSHGFRPNRSCHTALSVIKEGWKSTKWICEVDIKGFFDNIDHNLLLKFLSKRIDDEKFLRIIKKFLKAGVVDNWKYNATHSGTPQGGIISPILANIYLHELDEFMEKRIAEFGKGGKRKPNPEYKKLLQNRANRILWLKRGYGAGRLAKENPPSLETIEKWKREVVEFKARMDVIPSVDMQDQDFKRMRYIRYADDFVIGIVGSKADASKVMQDVTNFVETELNLEISEEKSHVVDFSKGIEFLGYTVVARSDAQRKSKCVVGLKADGRKTFATKRSQTGHIHLGVPASRVQRFCNLRGYGNIEGGSGAYSTGRRHLAYMSDYEIITKYNAELRGFANYYKLAPALYLNKLEWVWTNSLARTIAGKHQTSRNKVFQTLRGTDGRYVYKTERNGKKFEVEIFKIKNRSQSVVVSPDLFPNTVQFGGRTELLDRMSADKCEYCGSVGKLEIHHIKKMKDLNKGTEHWKRMMIARQRKTLALCLRCHRDLHNGRLPDLRADQRL